MSKTMQKRFVVPSFRYLRYLPQGKNQFWMNAEKSTFSPPGCSVPISEMTRCSNSLCCTSDDAFRRTQTRHWEYAVARQSAARQWDRVFVGWKICVHVCIGLIERHAQRNSFNWNRHWTGLMRILKQRFQSPTLQTLKVKMFFQIFH